VTVRHFLDLPGASTVMTDSLGLTLRAVGDVARHRALGVVHGPAGVGKTFAVERAVEALGNDWEPVWLSFPARPTMRLIATELLAALGGSHSQHDRFKMTRLLKAELALAPRLIVVDEAQNLNRECIEFLRHLSEDPERRGAILLVGGDGCWEVLSREPMLRSRVYRRVAFTPLAQAEVLRAIRAFHSIYQGAGDELIRFVDDYCGHGNFRNWASFTLSALDLCAELGRDRLDEQVARNAFALLGGGLGAA
jgi:type II secretory pathway predicted ATPase ExeA